MKARLSGKTDKKEKKKKSSDEIIDYVNKNFGNYIFKLSLNDIYKPEDFLHSGSFNLNFIMTGNPFFGYPKRGRIVELFGKESVAKTTLALAGCNEVLKQNGKVLYGNAEYGLNEFYTRNLIETNHENFYYFHAKWGEQFFEIAEELLKKFKFDLFVLDSIGGTKPKAWKEGKIEKADMGKHSVLVGKGTERLVPLFEQKKTGAIFINQLSGVIGGFGAKENTKGGKNLKYYEWVRIQLSVKRAEKITQKKGNLNKLKEESEEKEETEEETKNSDEIGTLINAMTVKNKLFIPRKACQLKLFYGKGFDKVFDFVSFLEFKGIAEVNKAKTKVKYGKKVFESEQIFKLFETDKNFREEISIKMKEEIK